MEFLLKPCQQCGEPMNGGVYRSPHICPHCLFEHAGGKARGRKRFNSATAAAEHNVDAAHYAESALDVAAISKAPPPSAQVVLTAKPAEDHTILQLMGEITSKHVLSMEITPDLVADGKFIGSKSEKVKVAVAQGKKHALAQLRQQAQKHGANIVVDVTVKNGVAPAGKGKVNITVSATGMAAKAELAQDECEV